MSQINITTEDILRVIHANTRIDGVPIGEMDFASFDWQTYSDECLSREFDHDMFFRKWHKDLALNPWQFSTSAIDKIQAGTLVAVVAYPSTTLRDAAGRNLDQAYRNGYEIPVQLIAETLDDETSRQLQAAVSVVIRLHNLESLKSRANQFAILFLLYVHLYHLEETVARLRMTPILERGSLVDCGWSQSQLLVFNRMSLKDKVELLIPLRFTAFSLESVLASWQLFGQILASTEIDKPEDQEGLWLFSMLPPQFKTFEEIEETFERIGLDYGAPLVQVPYENARLAKEVMDAVGDDTNALLERLTDDLVLSRAGQTQIPPDVCRFRKNGDYWVVGYRGIQTLLKHSRGLSLIGILLVHQGRMIDVLELNGVAEKKIRTELAQIIERMSNEELDGMNLIRDRLRDSQAMIDRTTRKEVLHAINKIKAKLKSGNIQTQSKRTEARMTLRKLEHYLRSSTGLGGRDRRFTTESDKLRKNIQMAISRSMEHIRPHHEQLYLHFRRSIQTGAKCSYIPEEPISWEL